MNRRFRIWNLVAVSRRWKPGDNSPVAGGTGLLVFCALLCALTSFLAKPTLASGEPIPTADSYAIVGGRVILEPAKSLDGATVLVRDGRIEAVGANLPIPFDAFRIDAAGLVVHAGFLDAGNSSGYDPKARPTSNTEDANVDISSQSYASTPQADRHRITPEFCVARALTVDEDAWEKWRLCGFTDRIVKPSGGILAGQSALVSLRGRPLLDAVLKERVALQVAFDADGRVYPVTLMGAVTRIRQAFADADHYRRREAFAAEKGAAALMPSADPAWTELQPDLDAAIPLSIRAQTVDEILRALSIADELKARVHIDGGREAWKLADRLSKRPVPILLSANFPERPKPSKKKADPDHASKTEPAKPDETNSGPSGRRDENSKLPDSDSIDRPSRLVKDEQRQWQEDLQGIAQLLETRLPIGLAFDGVAPDKVQKQIDLLAKEAGLDHDRILALLTTRAAEAIGVQDQLGSISPGKRAHLVVRKRLCTEKDSFVRYVLIDNRLFEYAEPKPTAKARKDDKKSSDDGTKDDAPKDAPTVVDTSEIPVELDSDRTPARPTGGNVLIRGARVLTVGPLGDRPDVDILVKLGKIAEIGANLKAEDGVPVIKARGWYVMPGIIDSHSHMAIAGGVNEYSLSITPEVRIRDVINSKDVTIYRALAGGVTTARILHGSANTIGGQDAVIKLRYGKPAPELLVADAPLGVKFALGENVTRNQSRFPNTRLGVEAVLVRAFSEADAYRKEWDAFRKRGPSRVDLPPRRDLRLEALANVLDGQIGVHCHCYRSDEILMLLGVADRFGFKIRSLQHGLEAYKIAPEVARHGCSVSTFSDWWAYKWEAYDATPYNTALLNEAGVPVCLKSDSPNVVRTMNQEAAKLLRYGGLSPQDSLATITLMPARQLKLDKRIGSIEVGKDADLAIFNGHPLNTYSRCELTLVDGEIYFQRPEASERVGALAVSKETSNNRPTAPSLDLPARPAAVHDRQFPIKRNETGRYVIVGADIHTVSGEIIRNGTLVVSGGKIEDVLSSRESGDDSTATVIDAVGLSVYPGFIDAGCKVGLAEVGSSRETLDYEESGPFQPDLRAAAAIHPDSALIPVTRAGGVTIVVSMPSGGVVSGQSALVQLAGWVPSEMVLVDPLALHLRFPGPPKDDKPDAKPFDGRGRFADLRDRRIQEVRSLVRLARHYHEAMREASERKSAAPPVDPRLDSLGPYIRKEKPLVIHADSARDILEAVRLAEELDLRLIVQGARDAWKVSGTLKERDIPVIAGPILTLPGERHDPYDAPFANLARLHAAGVRFCIQTDDTSNSRNLPLHAAIAVAYGLPPEEGLKAITLYPAEILGVADQLGSIDKGKIANLILCDGDPLQCSTDIKHLFIAGNPIAPTSKHTELYEKYRERLKGASRVTDTGTPTELGQ